MLDKNTYSKVSEPQPIGEILHYVLDDIEAGEVPNGRSDGSSLRWEIDNNEVLRNASEQPGVSDEEMAYLADLIHLGDLAIRALESGQGHMTNPSR